MDKREVIILSGLKISENFFDVEKRFKDLSIGQKIEVLMSHRPEIFQIETTTRCNLMCPLCSTHHLKRGYVDLSHDLLQKIVEENPQLRYTTLHLMGEPLMAKGIFEHVRYLSSRGIFTFFSTNGMWLLENATEIVESGLEKISISIDGMVQEDIEIYRKNANLNKIIDGIERLKALKKIRGSNKPIIQTQTLMFRYNEIKENELVKFLKSLNVDRSKLKSISTNSFGGRNSAGKDLPWEKLRPRTYRRDGDGFLRFRDRAVCRMLFQGFVLANGSVVPCCIDYDERYPIGDLKSSSWNQVFYSKRRAEILREYFEGRLLICKDCTMGYEYSWYV